MLFQVCFFPRAKKFLRKNGLPENALLLVDNIPSHPAATSLQCEGITVKFLPPNTTCIVQPMEKCEKQNKGWEMWKKWLEIPRYTLNQDSSPVIPLFQKLGSATHC